MTTDNPLNKNELDKLDETLKKLIDEYFAVNLAPKGVLMSTLMGVITQAINTEIYKARLSEVEDLLGFNTDDYRPLIIDRINQLRTQLAPTQSQPEKESNDEER